LASAARSGSWSFCALVQVAVDRNDFSAYGPTFDSGGAFYIGCGTEVDGTMPVFNDGEANGLGSSTGAGGAFPALAVGSTWHFVGGSYNSATGATLAVRGTGETGSSLTIRSATRTTGKSGTAPLYIGNNSFGEFLNGAVKQARIWTAALTQAEFEAEWNSLSAVVKTASLWAHYPLGSDANDASGNARHLTVNGTVTFDAAVDQEGFRWRNDDGSETTATWAAAQDTDVTAPLAANIRLRALVNTAGDSPSAAPKLYYKKSTDGTYLPVNVGSTGTQTAPVIETTAETAVSTAGTSHAITLPASIASTDLVLIVMDIGSTSATLNSLTDWTEVLDESAANGLKILTYTGTGVPTTPTFTSSGSTRSASIAYRISGVDKTITPQIGTTATGTSTTPNPPSVTPTAGTSKPYLFIAFFGSAGEEADDDTWVTAAPTNYTGLLQKSCGTVGTNLGGLIGAASRTNTSGSAEDPATFTMAVSAAWRAQTIIVHPATAPTPPIYVSPSANITAGGVATTAQLTAPSGKTTSDFTAGRMWDDENGTDAIDIAADFYTEVEWSLQAQSPAANTDIYQFRVYTGATPLDTYTVTPQWTIGAGGTDGTATPAVIALAAAMPAATPQAGTVTAPAVIARAVAVPAASTGATATATPTVTALTVATPAATPLAGTVVLPAVIARAVAVPAATGSGGSAGTAAPAVIARSVTVPAATGAGHAAAAPAVIPLAVAFDPAVSAGSTVGVDVIPLTVTVPQVAATGGGSATALPAVIPLSVTVPQAVTQGGAVVLPAATTLTVTIPQAVTAGGATVSPAVIPLAVAVPQASATGASTGTATPAVITTTVTIPQTTPQAASTALPAATVLTVTMPAALPQASKTATPAVIPLTVTIPAATASGTSASTATPNTITLSAVIPAPTLRFGYVVNPNVIALAVSIAAALATSAAATTGATSTGTIRVTDSTGTITVAVTSGGAITTTEAE